MPTYYELLRQILCTGSLWQLLFFQHYDFMVPDWKKFLCSSSRYSTFGILKIASKQPQNNRIFFSLLVYVHVYVQFPLRCMLGCMFNRFWLFRNHFLRVYVQVKPNFFQKTGKPCPVWLPRVSVFGTLLSVESHKGSPDTARIIFSDLCPDFYTLIFLLIYF